MYSPSWEDYLHHVEQNFQILKKHQLYLRLKKCAFGLREILYLGHIISGEGVKVDPNKIQVIEDWHVPNNVTELQGFLGLTTYYPKFVKDYGKIAQPLTNLLKKGKFIWTNEANETFESLKKAMTTTSVLAMPNFQHPFIIKDDSSCEGIASSLHEQGIGTL